MLSTAARPTDAASRRKTHTTSVLSPFTRTVVRSSAHVCRPIICSLSGRVLLLTAAAHSALVGATSVPRTICNATGGGQESMAFEIATVGGGCFWCIEACYNMLKGVKSAISGYAGGHVLNPTYKQVCNADTGHAEVVQVTYDPSVISFREILEVLFTVHDPTTKDRQGNDVGPQYRSIVFYHNEQQKNEAEAFMQEIAKDGWFSAPLTTELAPLNGVAPAGVFYPAEDYHQEYFKNNPGQGYCRVVVGPKVAKFRSKFAAKMK